MTMRDHLTPLDARKVHELIDRIATEIQASAYAIELELMAFHDTCTPHDARRLANALRHVIGRPDLAGEVEALLLT
jgi:hypothetical protein